MLKYKVALLPGEAKKRQSS